MPWLDRWLGKNPWCPIKFATFNNVAMYCVERIMERVQSSGSRATPDFLDDFIECKEQYPGVVGDNEVVSYLMMNVQRSSSPTLLCATADSYRFLLVPTRHLSCKKLLSTMFFVTSRSTKSYRKSFATPIFRFRHSITRPKICLI